MTIRPARVDDVVALVDLAAETFPLACPPELTEADIALAVSEFFTLEKVTRWVTDPHSVVFVADDDGQLAGYALAHIEGAKALLSKCYVRADGHGSGVASRLLDATVEAARELGATVMTLGTNQANQRALRFYEKHGFVRSGTRTFQVGTTTCQDYVLDRSLEV